MPPSAFPPEENLPTQVSLPRRVPLAHLLLHDGRPGGDAVVVGVAVVARPRAPLHRHELGDDLKAISLK